MFNRKNSLACAAIAACAYLGASAALAQTSTVSVSATTTGSTSTSTTDNADRLAGSFSTSVGSRDAAHSLVEGMRAGKDVQVGDITVSGTGKTMGYGSINNALSLAKAQTGATATPQDFLSALDKVMDMRASGMGWGAIAKSLGLNLGQAVSASRSNSAVAKAGHSAKSDKSTNVADAGKANGRGHGAADLGGGQGQGGSNGNGGGNGGGHK